MFLTREQAIAEAIEAAERARATAQVADYDANHPDRGTRAPLHAAVSSAWSDVARSYTDIAALLPAETEA